MNLNFKLNLKVSAFYLEKQKSFIPKKIFFGRTAKIHPKDGVSHINFPEGFDIHMVGCRSFYIHKVKVNNIDNI